MDNILNTITAYREERKWSLYDLATHAEMKSTTISTWYNNNATPTIPSLVKICDAFQITLSEFFAKAEGSESTPVVLTPQQMQLIDRWSVLRPDQQEAVLNLLNTIPRFYIDSNRGYPFFYHGRCNLHFPCSAHLAIIDKERTKNHEKEID